MQFKEWLIQETKVMILPEKKLEKLGFHTTIPDHAKKGAYLDADNFDFTNPDFENTILNGKFFAYGHIKAGYIDGGKIKHPPDFQAHEEIIKIKNLNELKKPNHRQIKINMITNIGNNKKWKWHNFSPDYESENDYYQIVSVELTPHHFYCLQLNLTTPFQLASYQGGEPKSRPTTYGKLVFNKKIGEVKISGNIEKPLYQSIDIT